MCSYPFVTAAHSKSETSTHIIQHPILDLGLYSVISSSSTRVLFYSFTKFLIGLSTQTKSWYSVKMTPGFLNLAWVQVAMCKIKEMRYNEIIFSSLSWECLISTFSSLTLEKVLYLIWWIIRVIKNPSIILYFWGLFLSVWQRIMCLETSTTMKLMCSCCSLFNQHTKHTVVT